MNSTFALFVCIVSEHCVSQLFAHYSENISQTILVHNQFSDTKYALTMTTHLHFRKNTRAMQVCFMVCTSCSEQSLHSKLPQFIPSCHSVTEVAEICLLRRANAEVHLGGNLAPASQALSSQAPSHCSQMQGDFSWLCSYKIHRLKLNIPTALQGFSLSI